MCTFLLGGDCTGRRYAIRYKLHQARGRMGAHGRSHHSRRAPGAARSLAWAGHVYAHPHAAHARHRLAVAACRGSGGAERASCMPHAAWGGCMGLASIPCSLLLPCCSSNTPVPAACPSTRVIGPSRRGGVSSPHSRRPHVSSFRSSGPKMPPLSRFVKGLRKMGGACMRCCGGCKDAKVVSGA